jgi:hypothetical protein
MHRRRLFLAHTALHKIYFRLRGGSSRMNAHETSAVWPLL